MIRAGIMLAAMVGMPQAMASQRQPGEAHRLTLQYETASKGVTSSGSSHGASELVERVIAVMPDGIELDYDLPADTKREARAIEWQFPVRIFKPHDGPPRLLNRRDLERRNEAWLKAAKIERAMCGKWVFTWNAFKIECDPGSAIVAVEQYQFEPPSIREGVAVSDRAGVGATVLKRSADGRSLIATFVLDPIMVQSSRAEMDVITGDITGHPVSLEIARDRRSRERVSGNVVVTFTLDDAGIAWQRKRVVTSDTTDVTGAIEHETRIETLTRTALPVTDGN